ncbi:cytochrome d ubiquinol oxidase subunit II [Pseudonocardia acidicola]|uniref:Cytochrome d ubiquinol oxidase subunit II n=1 Tax=Pseudonocardia acidicola TaxID=2724939 RepID=A0ABX1S7V9_9PSEU|nr:cytochrome d ubiquinol oxidase subunit II [Pseudonocardia acidicola]NMH97645.1 cytochrome d ubiquinol oxidase subunit II [Pseudonocardia acidicola]
MTLADVVLALMWLGVIAYALFAGADFGAGIWDLLAGGTRRGAPQRALIEHAIGPVWEANHVWLIFILVVLWTAFPPAFAAIASTLYIPFTLAAFGMIARGAAFAFRSGVDTPNARRLLGASFAFASLCTPFFLGAIAGAVASGRVPPGIAAGDVITSWVNPTSMFSGVLAVAVCGYLAAVYLCADARREHEPELTERFRAGALLSSLVAGVLALIGIAVLRADAPQLFAELRGRALPVVVVSALAGLVSIGLLVQRRYARARVAAAVAVAAVLCGWAVAQYPYLLESQLTIADGAAGRSTLVAVLVALVVGGVLLVPSLVFLYRLFQHRAPVAVAADPAAGPA